MYYNELNSKDITDNLGIVVAHVDKEYIKSLDNNLVLRVVNSVAGGMDYTTFYINDRSILSGVVSILTKRRLDCDSYRVLSKNSPEYARPFPMYLVFDNKSSLTKYKLRS